MNEPLTTECLACKEAVKLAKQMARISNRDGYLAFTAEVYNEDTPSERRSFVFGSIQVACKICGGHRELLTEEGMKLAKMAVVHLERLRNPIVTVPEEEDLFDPTDTERE